jgi:hypothetical protein
MKSIIIAGICSLFLISCKSEPSLEKYFVENAENKDFLQVDVSPSILNLDKAKLTIEQSTAMKSFDKMNVIAFKINDKNKAKFDVERAKVSEILKNEKYQQLMKFGSGKEGASISYVGDDDHISEFVLFGNKKETGFAVVRVLGKDMNPASIMTMVGALQSSKIDLEQLKPIMEMIKK